MKMDIAKLKNNKLPLMYLTEEEQRFMRDNWMHVEWLTPHGEWFYRPQNTVYKGSPYRISPDFKEQDERD